MAGVVALERFIVTQETAMRAEVDFGLGVVAANDGIIGALEESEFAIVDEFRGGRFPADGEVLDCFAGNHH